VYVRAGLRGSTVAVTHVLLSVTAFDALAVWAAGDGVMVVWLLSGQALAAAAASVMIAPQWHADRAVAHAVALASTAAAALLALTEAQPAQLLAAAPDPQLAGLAGLLAALTAAALLLPASGTLRAPAQAAAALCGWYLLSMVCVTFVDGQAGQLLLSAGWAAGGVTVFAAGLRDQQRRMWRTAGIVLLSAGAVKVVGHDLSTLDAVFRVLAAAVCGALLLTCTYLYSRAGRTQP
jgi:hypothetical protein